MAQRPDSFDVLDAFDGPVLALRDSDLPDRPDTIHAVELLSGRELPITEHTVSVYIERDDVACVAVLPVVLQLAPDGRVGIVDGRGGTLIVTAADGTELLTQVAEGGSVALDTGALPADASLSIGPDEAAATSASLEPPVAAADLSPFARPAGTELTAQGEDELEDDEADAEDLLTVAEALDVPEAAAILTQDHAGASCDQIGPASETAPAGLRWNHSGYAATSFGRTRWF